MTRSGSSRDMERLEQGLDRWGGDLDAWPSEARRHAERLLAERSEARLLFEAARRVDGALFDLMQDARVQDARAPVRVLRPRATPAFGRIAGWGMAGLAASLLLGFALGTVLPPPDDDDAGRIFIAIDDSDAGNGGFL